MGWWIVSIWKLWWNLILNSKLFKLITGLILKKKKRFILRIIWMIWYKESVSLCKAQKSLLKVIWFRKSCLPRCKAFLTICIQQATSINHYLTFKISNNNNSFNHKIIILLEVYVIKINKIITIIYAKNKMHKTRIKKKCKMVLNLLILSCLKRLIST